MGYVRKLLVNDLRNIVRDRLYLYAFVLFPIIFIAVARLVFPWISENVYPIEPLYPVLFMVLSFIIPMIFSFITAFLIMEERDENLLTILRVMPISRSSYLFYRMLLMTALSFVCVLVFQMLSGLVQVQPLQYLPVAVLFAMFTPLMALIINVLANNKVQGFAVMKSVGGLFLIPLLSLAITEDWKYLFGIFPNFWTFMALEKIMASGTLDLVYIGLGLIVHTALLALLARIFNKKF